MIESESSQKCPFPRRIAVRLALVVLFSAGLNRVSLEGTEGGYLLRGSGPAIFRITNAALLLSGQSGGALSTAVTAAIYPSSEESFQVIVATEVDAKRLQSTSEATPVELETFVYALNEDGEVVSRASQRLVLDPAHQGDHKEPTALKIVIPLDLPAGNYEVRALVTQTGTDRYGLDGTNVSIPGGSIGSSYFSSPWWVDSGNAWTVITPAEGLGSASGSIYLFDAQGQLQTLAAHPVVSVGSLLTGGLLAPNPTPESGPLMAQFLRADGMQIAEVPVQILQRSNTHRMGVDKLVFDVEIPALPPSIYGLSIGNKGTEEGLLQTTVLRLTVAEPELADAFTLWTQMDSEPPELSVSRVQMSPRASNPRDLEQRIAVNQDEIVGAYQTVFRHLAEGLPVAARTGLIEFEITALRTRSPAAISDLEKKEFQALTALTANDLVALLPIAVVYAEMIGEYHRRGLAPLSEHALKMSTQMTKPISRKSKKGLEPEVAANVLVSVAGYAILARRRGVGEELLLAALKLAPEHEGALLSLAASREQLGRYREAIDALEKLVGAYRTHREGRLRLAVNLERLGQTAEALDVYRSLENDGSRDWVELVATQQIVAILAAQGLLDQAASSLTLAIERWPSEPALRIQLAWVLDESGRLDIAGEMVEEILTTSGSASESARYRYNHWYSYVFDESRQTLAELVQQQAVEFEQASNQGPPSR